MAITKEQVEKKFIDSGVALGEKYATGQYLENRKLTTKVASPAEVIAYTMTTLQNDGADVDLVIDDKKKEWRIDYKYSDGSKDSISGPIIVTEAGTTTKKKVENTVVFRELNGMPVEVPASVAEAKVTADVIKRTNKRDDFKGAQRVSWAKTRAHRDIQRFQQPKTRSEAIEAKKEGQLSSDYVNAKRAYQQNIGPYVGELAKKIESQAKKQGIEAGQITTEIYGLLGRIVAAESESAAQAIANSILNSPDAEYVELSKIKGALQLVLKDAMTLKKSGYRFSYNTTSESSASTMKVSAVQARKIVDPIGLSPEFVRRQHDPAEMRIPSKKWKQKQKKSGQQMFHRNPLVASEAMGVLNPGQESPELLSRGNTVIPYDALVLGAEVTEEEAHRIGKSVREGASVAAEDFMEVVSTVQQEFEKEFSEKFAYRVAEKEYNQRTKGRRGKKKPPAFKDISEDEKNRYIKDALIRTLKNKYKINIDNASVDYIEGQYIVSGVGTKYAKDAQRLTSMYGIRSATSKATSEQISSLVGQRNGQNVTFIKEKEGINARNIGTHASQDIQTLFVRAAESTDGLKGLMDRIDSFVKNGTYKYADDSVVDFSEIAKIFQDFFKLSEDGRSVVTEGLLLDKLQNATDPEIFSKLLLFTDVLQNPTADTQFYAPRFGDDGRLNVARTNNRRYFYDALSATNQFYYGAYDKYGAVSMASGADSIDRLAAIAGLSESDAKKISDLLRPSEEEQAELEELRKRDAEARRRTYQTAEKDFDSSKLIGDEDYVIIGRGSGDNIIDISTIQKAVRDENGRITNESEMLVGRLNEYIEKKFGSLSDEERKEKLDKLQIVIDLGDNLGETTTYVDEYGNPKTYFAGGTHAFLRQGVSSNKNIFDNAQQLINALNIEGVNKKYLNEQFIEFLASMSNDVNYKEGRSYQEVWKQKQPRSMYGAAASFSTKDILSDKEYESASDSEKLISDIASYGAAISANTAQEMLEDRAAFSTDQLRDMLKSFSGKDFKKTIKDKNGKLKSVRLNRAETIQEILKYLTIGSDEFNKAASMGTLGDGLSAFIGRLPFMNGLDIKALGNLFIDPSFKDSGLKLSVGLSKLMNADFDGDKIAAALIALSDMGDTPEDIEAFKKNFSKLTATSKAIAGKMAKITKQAEEQEEDLGFSAKESGNLRKELEMAATIASRVDKGKTGIFSNYASEIRERMKNAGIDETGGIRDETSALRAVRAMLTRGLLETNEQNVISSKKTILRMAKIQAGGKELTSEDEINKYYSMAINEISKFNEQWRTGKLTLSEFLDKLTELGVTGSGKDGESFIEGRVMQQIMLAAEEMVDKVSGGDKEKAKNLWHQMFGENVRRYDELGGSEKYLYGQGLTRDIFEKSFSAVADQLGTTADDLLKEAIWHTNTPEKRRVDPESESAAYHLTRDEQGKTHYVDASALKPEFYQMVEKSAKSAKKAVDEERVAEEQKIVVAGKEARAISALTVSYGGLASEVEGLKEIGASKGWNTVTGFASQLAPFGRMGTDAGYGNISSRLDRIFANQNDTDEFISMSQEERARRFGYGGDISSFEKERGAVLSSIYGTAAHSISQVLSEASQKYGEDILNLDALKKIGDQELINQYQKALDIQEKKMRILGFSEDEIQKQSFKTSYSGERNFESLLNLVGGEKGKRFVNLGKPEQSIVGENALGEKLYGQIDATYISKYLDQSGAEKSIFNVVDYKNLSGEIKPENVIQVLTYIALLRQLKAEVQKMKSEGMSESDAIDEIVRKNTDASGNQRYSKEFIQNILSSNDFAGKLISTSKGVTTQYSIKDPGTALMSKILSGNLSNEDLKTLMSFVTKNVSTTSQLPATEEYKQKIGEETTVAEAQKKEEESAKKAEEDKKELKKQYIVLLREEESLLEKIDKLNHQIKETQGRGEDVTALKKDLSVYRRAKNAVRRKMRATEFSVLKDENGNIVDDDILSEQAIQGAKRKSRKSLLGIGDAEDTLKAFERYAERRIGLEAKIEDATIKAQTAQTTNARKAFENLKTIYKDHLSDTDEVFEKLKAIVGKEFPDQFKEITERMKEQKLLLFAQKAASNRGNRTIFDVIKSDIQRATMRITDFGLAARVLNTARKEIQQVYQNILKLNEAMTNLRIVTGSNTEQAKSMMNAYNDLAMQLGTTTQAVAQSAAEWLRQGYSVSEANELIKSSTYLSRLGFMDMGQSVTALTSVMKGFRIEATNSMDIVDKLTQLDAKYATTAGDIATALSRTSAVAREAGLSLDQTAAALTTMIDVSQQDASSVGNAFRTILARYGNVKATAFTSLVGDSEDIDDANGSINDTEKVLGAIGIKIRSSSSDMRDFDDVMDELADKWVTLTDVEKNAVSTALAGVRQRNIFGIYMENYDTYKQAISEAEKAEGTAARKMQAYNESVAYSINQLSAAWEGFAQKLEASGAVKLFFQLLTVSVEKFGTILSQVVSTIVSLRSFKLTTDLKRLADFFGFGSSEGKGRWQTKKEKTAAWFSPNRMTQQAAQEKEKYEQQQADTSEKRSRNEVVNSNNKVVDALNRNADALDRNSNAQNAKQVAQSAASMPTPNTPPVKSWATEYGTLNGKYVFKTADGKWKYGNRHNIDDSNVANVKLIANPGSASSAPVASASEVQGEQRQSDVSRHWLLGLTGSTISGAGYFAAKKARKNIPLLEQQIKNLKASGNFDESTSSGLANIWELQELTDQLEKDQNTLKVRDARVKELKANWKQGAIRGIGTGLTAGVIAGMSAEGDAQDKIVTGASTAITTGLLSAIPGVGAILGPILGPVLGGFFGKEINKLLKADEVARKERVQQAKDNLEAIKEIENSVTGLIDLNKKDRSLWDSDDWKQFNEQVETINEALEKSELGDKIINLGNSTQTLSKYFEEAARTGNRDMLARVEAERIRFEAEKTYAAGEQDRYDLQKEINENQKKLAKLDSDEISKQNELNAAIKAARAELESYSEALKKGYMQASFYSSGVGTMESYDIGNATLDRIIMQIAREWAKDSPDIFAGNQLTSDARSEIISYLREQSGYSSLFKNDTKNVGDMLTARDAVDDLRKSLNMSQKQLKEFANSKDLSVIADKFGATGDALYKIIDQINLVDEDGITTIAHAMNMTVEEFEKANADGAFNWLTTDVAIGGIDKLNEKMQTFNDLLSAASEGSLLTSENLNKIANQFPTLLRGVDEAGKYTTDLSSDNILDNIIRMMTNEDSLRKIYSGLFSGSVAKDSEIWNNFMTLGKGSEIAKSNLSEDIKERVKKAGSYSDIVDLFATDEMKEYNDAFKEYVTSMYPITDLLDTQAKILEEYGKHTLETEISNLESVRDSLDDVNKQREKELELIKAKEALENASKEKKRVYRAGVGFVYTTDQEAVKSAQDKVDELERQRDKDNIQYQIDSLQQQKEILENIENNKQLESLIETAEKILGSEGSDGGITGIISAVKLITGDEFTNKIKEQIKTGITEATTSVNNEAKENAGRDYQNAINEAKAFQNGEVFTGYDNDGNATFRPMSDEEKKEFGGQTPAEIAKHPNSPYYAAAKQREEDLIENVINTRQIFANLGGKVSSEDSFKGENNGRIFTSKGNKRVKITGEDGNIAAFEIGGYFDWEKNTKQFNTSDKKGGAKVLRYAKQNPDGTFEQMKKFDDAENMTIKEAIDSLEGPAAIMNLDGKNYIMYKGADGKTYEMSAWDFAQKRWEKPGYAAGYSSIWNTEESSYTRGRNEIKAPDLINMFIQGSSYASGTLSAPGGRSLINENGLESIITPSGTITSLPAKSGIIPADLTRNLWALGKVAPNLIARLGGNNLQTNNSNSVTDNSINISNLDATFYTEEGFDGEAFLRDLKSQVILTSNNH